MLKKLEALEIDPKDPFKDDQFESKQKVEQLAQLIKSAQEPFVLTVEAPWGWGKSTLLRMWQAHAEAAGELCLRFNAWESDFVADPLVAFLGEMQKAVDLHSKQLGTAVGSSWETLKKISGKVLRKALPVALQVATHGLITHTAVADAFDGEEGEAGKLAAEIAKERIDQYMKEKEGIKHFRITLETFAAQVRSSKPERGPIIFFIDELDRCRPDFAIVLLERVKHLFSVRNIVFVLAIDRGQLAESVKTLYGTAMDADGYLRRFIDLSYRMEPPDFSKFAHALFSRFSLNDYFSQRPRGQDAGPSLIKCFAVLSEHFNMSLRTQEQCFTRINVVLRTTPVDVQVFPLALPYLAALQTVRPNLFHDLRRGALTVHTFFEQEKPIEDVRIQKHAEIALKLGFLSDEEIEKWGNHLRSERTKPNDEADQTLAIVRFLSDNWNTNGIRPLLAKLEFSSQFR